MVKHALRTERAEKIARRCQHLILWWVLTGSNRRPTRCKRAALPAELSTQFTFKSRQRHLFRPNPGRVGEKMARVTGLEPATSGVTGRHSNQLSYTRVYAAGTPGSKEGELRASMGEVKRCRPGSATRADMPWDDCSACAKPGFAACKGASAGLTQAQRLPGF